MGRHARPDDATSEAPTPEVPTSGRTSGRTSGQTSDSTLAGWGAFATLVATALVAATGRGWVPAVEVLGLGAGATAVLWAAARETAGRRAGHRSETGRARSVKWRRDQRER
jgi:hypothetical protein